jgi:hypothetical protein
VCCAHTAGRKHSSAVVCGWLYRLETVSSFSAGMVSRSARARADDNPQSSSEEEEYPASSRAARRAGRAAKRASSDTLTQEPQAKRAKRSRRQQDEPSSEDSSSDSGSVSSSRASSEEKHPQRRWRALEDSHIVPEDVDSRTYRGKCWLARAAWALADSPRDHAVGALRPRHCRQPIAHDLHGACLQVIGRL